uniref:Methylenetetrahydrofolate reductase (NAD(P)H) n=1 Tax=Haptolina brevifila TaxID=156173 RepID=A0A7S2JL28_9EUKA
MGIHDVLVTGSPPNTPPPASGSGKFASATELVSFVKERMGDAMRVAVCGYPRGSRGERGEYAADLAEVGRQVLAGAERVVCLPCFDAETHWSFVADARAARISCPIAPGLLPIYSAAEFRHVCRALAVDPPAWLEAKLRAAAGTKEVAALGESLLVQQLEALNSSRACTPHIYTLNSEAILQPLALAGYKPLKHRA